MKNTSNNLGTESIGKLLVRLAIPAITAQLINALYNIVDRMYIGNIKDVGTPALTGLGVTLPIIIIITAFSSLIGMGGAPRAAIEMGKGDNEKAEKILGNCAVLLLISSVILTVVFSIYKEPLLYMFGASKNTITYATDYLGIYVLGTVFVLFTLGLNAFITTQGFAKTSMMTVLIGAVLNIVLDPLFIYVFNMGVKGAALATIISQAVSAVWVVVFLLGGKTKLRLRFSNFKLESGIILPVLALGLSPFIMQSTESLLSISFNYSLQKYGGDNAVGAMTIMASVMQLAMLPLTGLTQSAQPIISYNYGARKTDRVKKTFKLLLISSLVFTTLTWMVAMFFPEILIALFSSDESLVGITVYGIRIYMAALFMLGAQTACQQTFVALSQAKVSLLLALLRKIILLIPLIFILPGFIDDKVTAVLLAEPVADFLASVTTVIVFAIMIKKILDTNNISKEDL